jgi:hypothetical protein
MDNQTNYIGGQSSCEKKSKNSLKSTQNINLQMDEQVNTRKNSLGTNHPIFN